MDEKDIKCIYEQFPFEQELRNGGFYETIKELKDLGFGDDQIWSVCEVEQEDGSLWYVTGPSHHSLNLLGFIATFQRHDGLTYYYEQGGD